MAANSLARPGNVSFNCSVISSGLDGKGEWLTQVDVLTVRAAAAANDRRHPALIPENSILAGCIPPFFAPVSASNNITSGGSTRSFEVDIFTTGKWRASRVEYSAIK